MLAVRALAFAAMLAFTWAGVRFAEMLYVDQRERRFPWPVTLGVILLALGSFGAAMVALFLVIAPQVLVA